ncbi:transglutaminase family protein [soil metagenome]
MLLEIRHLTRYRYAETVRESVMELWMQPQKTGRQRLISFDLDLEPAVQLFSYADLYGNAVYHFDVPQPHNLLTIKARAAVETSPLAVSTDPLDLGEWERLKSEFVRGDCFDFLRPHSFVTETDRLKQFEAELGIPELRRQDPWTAVQELSAKLYAALAYVPGSTEADSPIDLAIEHRKGVCQDFAHIMIAICRAWGVPARYVSGYLYTDRKEDRSSPDATHAWVEVFLPSLRWVGIDPTNNILAGERHVAVAIGRDYADVPPSRGVYKGESESELDVAVSVTRPKTATVDPEFMPVTRPPVAANARRRLAEETFREHQQQQQQQQ